MSSDQQNRKHAVCNVIDTAARCPARRCQKVHWKTPRILSL